MHALENPVFHALTTTHRAFAVTAPGLVRYQRDVAPFVAIAEPGPVDAGALAALVDRGEPAYFLGPRPTLPTGWRLEDLGVIVQMHATSSLLVDDGLPIVEVEARDHGGLREIIALVYPHYFRPRTIELGRYHAIRDADAVPPATLRAIIGERMALPGYREISAVCTHPAHGGRGHARRLLAHATNAIRARGEQPFLHVSPANTRAVALYEQNGYRRHVDIPFFALHAA